MSPFWISQNDIAIGARKRPAAAIWPISLTSKASSKLPRRRKIESRAEASGAQRGAHDRPLDAAA